MLVKVKLFASLVSTTDYTRFILYSIKASYTCPFVSILLSALIPTDLPPPSHFKMKIAKLASLVFAIRVTAFATSRDASLADDRAVNVREELATGESVPETAEDIWGSLTGDNNCLGCQVRRFS